MTWNEPIHLKPMRRASRRQDTMFVAQWHAPDMIQLKGYRFSLLNGSPEFQAIVAGLTSSEQQDGQNFGRGVFMKLAVPMGRKRKHLSGSHFAMTRQHSQGNDLEAVASTWKLPMEKKHRTRHDQEDQHVLSELDIRTAVAIWNNMLKLMNLNSLNDLWAFSIFHPSVAAETVGPVLSTSAHVSRLSPHQSHEHEGEGKAFLNSKGNVNL